MSLINKMLQDLDARGTPGGDAFSSSVKPVAPERRAPSLPAREAWAGAGMAGVAALAGVALAWFGWSHFHAARPGPRSSATAAARPLAPGPQAMRGAISPAPAAASAPAAQVAPAGAVAPQTLVAPARLREKTVVPQAPAKDRAAIAHAPAPARLSARAPQAAHAPQTVHPAQTAHVAAAAHVAQPGHTAQSEHTARTEQAAQTSHAANAGHPVSAERKVAPPAPAEGRQESSFERAENAYRRALDSLQDGRVSDALAALQLALRIDPGHDAARQTLVGLLVEARRPEDAIRELQLGLARDPRQPALAMLLARLQIERGGSGIETLQRTLPYADKDADYHAFLAGALQRQGRQREAADQYRQALRSAPGNGVWWMGLGISLEADKRGAEALDAFRKARASASLTPELQAFVERRLQQLAR